MKINLERKSGCINVNLEYKILEERLALDSVASRDIGFPDYKGRWKNIKTSFNLELQAFCHNEYVEKTFITDQPVERKKLLETKYNVIIPKEMYNPQKPLTSQYLHPYRYQRDGDEAQEIGYRPAGTRDVFKPIDDRIGGDFGVCSPNISMFV